MTVQNCPKCGAENPAGSKYCGQCGESVGPAEREGGFRTLVAILIAVVSIVGAVLAWRAAQAGSSAADADVRGTVSIINRNQALVASDADMYRNLSTYLQVRIHDMLSLSLFADYERRASDDPKLSSLWDEGWTEVFVAEAYLDQVNVRPEYIRPDGSYDGKAAQDIDMATRSLGSDFDPQGRHFAQADRLRTKVLWLVGLALVLSVTLLCYTVATVIQRRVKYVFFAVGSVIFVLVIAAAIVVELSMA
jgi:hypothetical protein